MNIEVTKKEFKKLYTHMNNMYETAVNRYLEKTDFDVYEWLLEEESTEYSAIEKLENEPFAEMLTEEENQVIENLLKEIN